MTLKENLVGELQKLRLSREKPRIKQVSDRAKREKKSKLTDEAKRLLADVEESE